MTSPKLTDNMLMGLCQTFLLQIRFNIYSDLIKKKKPFCTLREEPSQINVILQQKVLAAKLRAVCTVYKQ